MQNQQVDGHISLEMSELIANSIPVQHEALGISHAALAQKKFRLGSSMNSSLPDSAPAHCRRCQAMRCPSVRLPLSDPALSPHYLTLSANQPVRQ